MHSLRIVNAENRCVYMNISLLDPLYESLFLETICKQAQISRAFEKVRFPNFSKYHFGNITAPPALHNLMLKLWKFSCSVGRLKSHTPILLSQMQNFKNNSNKVLKALYLYSYKLCSRIFNTRTKVLMNWNTKSVEIVRHFISILWGKRPLLYDHTCCRFNFKAGPNWGIHKNQRWWSRLYKVTSTSIFIFPDWSAICESKRFKLSRNMLHKNVIPVFFNILLWVTND